MKNLMVSVDPYMSNRRSYKVEGKDLVECLLKIIEQSSYPIDEDYDEEITVEYLLEHIEENNGDGCDYVISIVDLEDGDITQSVFKHTIFYSED